MYCGKCGFKIRDDSKFCGNCGAVLENDMPSMTNYDGKMNSSNGNLVEQDKKKNKIAVLIIVFVILGVIGLVGVFAVVIFNVVSGSFNKEYFNIGGNEVLNFYYAEDVKYCSYNSSSDTYGKKLVLEACESDDYRDAINRYVDTMVNDYGYEVISSDIYRTIRYCKDGYVIEVSLEYYGNVIYRGYYVDNIDSIT